MKTKHTPGPWKASISKNIVSTMDGILVAECHPSNAHLIAAAPAMLEALETAERLTTDMMILAGLRAAIKKAKGE